MAKTTPEIINNNNEVFMDEESERFKDVQKLHGNDLGEVSKVIVVLYVDAEAQWQYKHFSSLIQRVPIVVSFGAGWKLKVVQFRLENFCVLILSRLVSSPVT